jgi:hypothetical protein
MFFSSANARAIGNFVRGDIDALMCLSRALGVVQVAQRIDAGGLCAEMRRGPFGAQAPEIGGVVGITAHPDDAFSLALNHHAAADATVATG